MTNPSDSISAGVFRSRGSHFPGKSWMLALSLALPGAGAYAVTLDQLLVQAMSTYPSIRAQESNRNAASEDVRAARLRYFPSPSVSTQGGRVNYSGNGAERDSNRPVTTFSITQPLYMGGALDAGRDRTAARLDAAEHAITETRQEVGRRVVNAYAEWKRAYLKVVAMQESVAMHEKLLGLIERRAQSGIATDADTALARSRLSQARAEFESYRSAEQTQRISLGELTGQPWTSAELASSVAQPVSVPVRETGMAQAMEVSPTLRRLAQEVKVAGATAREARAQGRPQVQLQVARQVGNTPASGNPNYTSVGLVVQYAPGAGLSSYAAANSAYQLIGVAEQQLETARSELRERVGAEYSDLEFAERRKAALQESAALADDVSASYDRQYRVGRKTWIDLMNAVRERAQASTMLADVEASLLGASRRISIYTGKLFPEPVSAK